MDLLISYSWGQFYRAKHEAIGILQGFGDPDPKVEKTAVLGIAVAHTSLDNREVIRRCRALWKQQPLASFEFSIKWVPMDHWCATDLDAMKQLIDDKIKPQIAEGQTWGMKVHKRRWQKYHTDEIVDYLAEGIDRQVDLNHPDWIIWVDVIGRWTAISLLRPDEIFSLGLPHP